jgi:hypothetical protein
MSKDKMKNMASELKIKKILSLFYLLILAVALFIMISPFPEGTIILSFILGYFGYHFSGGSLWTAVLTYVITFPITLIVTKKLHLIGKLKKEFKRIRETEYV